MSYPVPIWAIDAAERLNALLSKEHGFAWRHRLKAYYGRQEGLHSTEDYLARMLCDCAAAGVDVGTAVRKAQRNGLDEIEAEGSGS